MEVLDHTHNPEPPIEPPEIFAPDCHDQLPVIARVGRGLRGDSYKVVVASDSQGETYLEGLSYDAATKTWTSEWMSQNINGGQLMYQYNLRPYTNPQTFTITFRYKRPNRSASEWVWTTPAIPYIWDADDDGFADVDGIVGVGVGSLFMKKTTDSSWITTNMPTSHTIAQAESRQEKLLYPANWTRDMFNAPKPGDPWTVNLQYGIGGDLDAPNIDDIAKLLGITVTQVRNIIANQTGQFAGSDNAKDYVDDQVKALSDHIHGDMGFGTILVNDGDSDSKNPKRNTIKKWFDWVIGQLGFGNDINSFGSTGATTVKGYIDTLVDGAKKYAKDYADDILTQAKDYANGVGSSVLNQANVYAKNLFDKVEMPHLYTQTFNVKLAFYDLDNRTANIGDALFINLVENSIPIQTIDATLSVSYFDVLPMIEFDMEVVMGQYFNMSTKYIGIACEESQYTLSGYTPFDLVNRTLPGRASTLKAPLINPETLANSGYSADPPTSGNWQVYAGVGNLVARDNTDAWPWGRSSNAIFYIFNRSTGGAGPAVLIDYARTYNCSYNQATLG